MKIRLHTAMLILLTLALLSARAAFAQNAGESSNSIAARVDKVFAQWDKKDSPGCALAVIKDGAITYKRGYGMANLDHDIPITPSSIFHVASVSKQFTAMAIMLLAQQDKLSLDDEVRKYIPELPDYGNRITIRHLMHHTSGLRDQWNLLVMSGWRLGSDVVMEDDVLEVVSRQKELNFRPGEEFLYSNSGYTLMAIIVKRASGKSLREFTGENIFKPLGMTRTHFRDDHAEVVKNQAYGYAPAGPGRFRLSNPDYDTVGASSLLTTVEDLALWDQNFYDRKVGGGSLLEQMQVSGTLNSGEKITYALGLVVSEYKGLKIVEHAGGDAGFRSHLMRFPDQRFSVACLCNSANTNPVMLARQVADIYLADQFKNDNKPVAAQANAVKLSEKELAAKAGTYHNRVTDDIRKVSLMGGKLYFGGLGSNNELLPLASDRFQMVGQPVEITFDPAGRLSVITAGRKPDVFDAVKPVDPTPAQLAEYAGVYYSDEIEVTCRITLQDGKLMLKRKKFPGAALSPAYKDAFTGFQVGSIRFVRNPQNRVTGFRLSNGRVRNFLFSRQ